MLDEEQTNDETQETQTDEVETPVVNEEPTPINGEAPTIISVDDLKERLRLAGIDYSKYTDDDLQSMITLTLERIEAETDLPIINPRLITEYDDEHHSKVYETDFYPLICCEIRINDELIEAHRIDMDRGIIYFKPHTTGELEVKYKIQYTNTQVLTSLITNMIILDIDGDTVHGTWNSIKEGEVSVTYGAGSGGLQSKVDEALNELKGYYKPRVRLL